ncbi:unnamed protein product [Penicillium glandicola]
MPQDFGNITNIMGSVEQWGDHHSTWSINPYNFASGWMQSDQLYPYEENPWFPSVFTGDVPPSARQAIEMAISQPFEYKRLNYGENDSLFATKDLPDPTWLNHPDLVTTSKPLPMTTSQEALLSMQDIRKSLLRLKVGLLEDLELVENGSMRLESSSLFYENSNMSIETLDLPIYRLLDHSSWLLAIIRSLCGTVEEGLDVTLATQRFESQNIGYDVCIVPETVDNGLDEDITTLSPYDSGYHTATTSPDRMTTPTIPKCDIALWLGILEAHCSLVCIYRAVFMRLYQLFLIIPPADAANILLLPKVRFGQFNLDGNLIVQVQLLVEFSSTMIGKLDRALKLPPASVQPQGDREFDPHETVRQKDWSTSIRDIILAQEQDPCEMSLMEIMDCLRQLAKEPVIA